MADVKIYPDPDSLARAGAELFVVLAEDALAARGRFTVALSGGSTPRAMYTQLCGLVVDWARVQVFWGDERCVPPSHPESSYRMARETLLDHIPLPPANVHRIQGEADPGQAAADYEQELRAAFGNLLPRFDLILLGLGDDGHMASIFPGTSAVREEHAWVVAQAHDFPPPPLVTRITFTPPLINAAAHVVFLVAGAGKAERLQQVLRGPYQPEVTPAQSVKPTHGRLVWMVDEAAAKKL